MRTASKKNYITSYVRKTFLFIVLFILALIFFLTRSMITAKAVSPEEVSAGVQQKYYMSYEVQDGDTLWDLAGEYNDFSVQDSSSYIEEVRSMNHITGESIHAGEFIVLPYFGE